VSTKTFGQELTDLRAQLDEQNTFAQYWKDSELLQYINDGVRDLARRGEVILSFNTTLDAIVGQAKYNLPPDVIRVHRCEFIPSNSTQVYPVMGSTYDELDQIWGINPTTQSSYPSVYACWGTPGQMTIQFYPVPAQTGSLNLYYYAMPVDLPTDGTASTQVLNVPTGWEDVLIKYAMSRALLKMRDSNWEVWARLYEEDLSHLIEVTRQAHDNGRYIQTMTGYVPQWLYAFADEQ
jgi:hypothetical protein